MMSEEMPFYGQTLADGSWSVHWSVRLDENPIGIAITDETGVMAIPLTVARAELLRSALDEALRHTRWPAPAPALVLRFGGNGEE